MIKTSFKQAWAMMKQNRLFTTIYVAGTGLSVAFTLILFIIYYVKFVEDLGIRTKPFNVCHDMIEVETLGPGTYKLVTDNFSCGKYNTIFYKQFHLEYEFEI